MMRNVACNLYVLPVDETSAKREIKDKHYSSRESVSFFSMSGGCKNSEISFASINFPHSHADLELLIAVSFNQETCILTKCRHGQQQAVA